MPKTRNNYISKKSAQSVLKALFSPVDLRRFEFLRAVFVSGLPGSGKSTVARLLKTCYGFDRLSSDYLRQRMFKQKHREGEKHNDVMAVRYLVYEELAREVIRAIQSGKRVVVDGTNMEPKSWIILGGVLTQIPSEQVAFVTLKPPEWIMKKRFENKEEKERLRWWKVYKYWRKYMKEGGAAYPNETLFKRIKIIPVRRYSIRTFDWVPDIKGILWDIDSTLYKPTKQLRDAFDEPCIELFSKAKKLSKREGRKLFWATFKRLKSKTKTMEWAGLDSKKVVSDISMTLKYGEMAGRQTKVVAMLKLLNHLNHYIYSNGFVRDSKYKLKSLGIPLRLFKGFYGAYECPYAKIDPKSFKWVVKQTGLRVEQLLSVGDREPNDITPAKAVGMRTCMIGGVSREADVSLPTVYEVAELFGKEL